jgi:hypothetical protein
VNVEESLGMVRGTIGGERCRTCCPLKVASHPQTFGVEYPGSAERKGTIPTTSQPNTASVSLRPRRCRFLDESSATRLGDRLTRTPELEFANTSWTHDSTFWRKAP